MLNKEPQKINPNKNSLGINFKNSKQVIDAGANILVSGTTIFKENNGNIYLGEW